MLYIIFMQNFKLDVAVISVSSNFALIMCYLINTYLRQSVILSIFYIVIIDKSITNIIYSHTTPFSSFNSQQKCWADLLYI